MPSRCNFNRFLPVGSCEYRIALEQQDAAKELKNARSIIHNQNCFHMNCSHFVMPENRRNCGGTAMNIELKLV